MSCNCNAANPNCEPCAICTPPGVKCLPDCNPKEQCEETIDLCCVRYSGVDQDCSDIQNGDPLCELLIKFLEIEFPASECCELEFSIDIIPNSLVTTTTTTSTTTSTTSTSTTSTSTTSTSTTSTTSTTTIKPPIYLCYSLSSSEVCSCIAPID